MTHALALASLVLILSAVTTLADAPSTSPRPEPRPDAPSWAGADVQAMVAARTGRAAAPPSRAASAPLSAAGAHVVAVSPHPPARPVATARAHLQRVSAAGVRGQPSPETITGGRPRSGAEDGAALCGVPGLSGRSIAPIVARVEGCGIARPVEVVAVDGVRLSTPATLDCDAARALVRWLREAARPAIGRTGGGIAELRIAAHYVCRTRNHRPGARISEHGRGRAIDISGLTLADGTSISVLGDWRGSPHSAALRRMHRQACGIFTTTLGPGSDGMHEDHLHFDVAVRRNRATYCR